MARNPFEIRGLDKNPLDELLALNRARRAQEVKNREAQRQRDEQIVLNKRPSPTPEEIKETRGGFFGIGGEKVGTGRYQLDGEEISADEYNQIQLRNKIINDATARLRGGQTAQNAQPQPKQPSVKQGRMGLSDRVKLLPDQLRTSLSSFMSGNRGGMVVGQPNTPMSLDQSATKLQRDAEAMSSGKLPVQRDKRLDRQTDKTIRQYKRKEAIDKVKEEGSRLKEATKQKLGKSRDRIKQAIENEKPYFNALVRATPSFNDVMSRIKEGALEKFSQFKARGLQDVLPQARVVQKGQPTARNLTANERAFMDIYEKGMDRLKKKKLKKGGSVKGSVSFPLPYNRK